MKRAGGSGMKCLQMNRKNDFSFVTKMNFERIQTDGRNKCNVPSRDALVSVFCFYSGFGACRDIYGSALYSGRTFRYEDGGESEFKTYRYCVDSVL